LHLALESPQGIFQRLTLLDNYFSHVLNSPPIRFGLVSAEPLFGRRAVSRVFLWAPPLFVIIACIGRIAVSL
jgi:hypothetical protein